MKLSLIEIEKMLDRYYAELRDFYQTETSFELDKELRRIKIGYSSEDLDSESFKEDLDVNEIEQMVQTYFGDYTEYMFTVTESVLEDTKEIFRNHIGYSKKDLVNL